MHRANVTEQKDTGFSFDEGSPDSSMRDASVTGHKNTEVSIDEDSSDSNVFGTDVKVQKKPERYTRCVRRRPYSIFTVALDF